MKRISLILGVLLFCSVLTRADEGMWLPFLLKDGAYEQMKSLGLNMSLEELYSENGKSLKDAIVMMDGGSCTGIMVSSKGLFFTNHHCGYDKIQSHSTVEHDYLTDGFWAFGMDEELPNPGMTASFLERIEDVSDKVLNGVEEEMTEDERLAVINNNRREIINEACKDTDYNANIRSMFAGNEYYLFVYTTYRDVRLVGAPPHSIGNFGDDTDNWMWPRHTGDFSMFRVYTAPDGSPATFSEENIPYNPGHFVEIALEEKVLGDFSMIWGYPGRTDRYLPSLGIDRKVEVINPAQVKLKEAKMEIMKKYMDQDKAIDIMYTGTYSYLANFWKKGIEEAKALKRLGVANQKAELEAKFEHWAKSDNQREAIYGKVIGDIQESYAKMAELNVDLAMNYYTECIGDCQALTLAFILQRNLAPALETKTYNDSIGEQHLAMGEGFFSRMHLPIDQNILSELLEMMYQDLPKSLQPDIIQDIVINKYKGDFKKYASECYNKSAFGSLENFRKFMKKPKLKKLNKDPLCVAAASLFSKMRSTNGLSKENADRLNKARRLYLKGLREMMPEKAFYPDANSSMRVTYGVMDDYNPRDGVHYKMTTYLTGVMDKEIPGDPEFDVPARLKEIYQNKEYGIYGEGDQMPLCFLTNHDITGGNSGSPVFNADGQLIGLAFDGNSEAMSGDIEFDEDLQKCINVDMRYVLLVIDKYAGAKNLIDELSISKE